METQSNYLSSDIRYYIVVQAEAGFRYEDIIDMVKENYGKDIVKGTISKLRTKFKKEGTLEEKPKRGRHCKKSDESTAMIIEAVQKNPKLNACAIAKDPKLNPEGPEHLGSRQMTRLLNTHGLFDTTYVLEKIPQQAMDIRVAFATNAIEQRWDWTSIIFSDEADLFPDHPAKLLHFRSEREERDDVDSDDKGKSDPRKVKVWGTISIHGVGTLVRYERNLDSLVYRSHLETYLLKDFPLLRGTKTRRGKYTLHLGSAMVHTGDEVKKWFEENRVHIIKWPSYSPDINPIEKVWKFIKKELSKSNTTLATADQTWNKIRTIWYNQVPLMLEELYSSLPSRMQTLISIDGKRIS